MRSHMHYDQQKDIWALEMKVPRNMAPVLLGFVLWYPGTIANLDSSSNAQSAAPEQPQLSSYQLPEKHAGSTAEFWGVSPQNSSGKSAAAATHARCLV